ncbi:MAG: DUF3800 domain-containing protein [Candidatus Nomurabacteria bacterium]|nr:DUF3800 domain-containing protein [Candidatus Nomurabacteria bacterium]
MFFKNNKEIKTEDLKLSDYNQIWTKFCFLDESGSLNNKTEPYFTLGILKMSQPYYLQNKILYERTKNNFHDEIKFNKLSKSNIDFAKLIIDSIFNTKSLNFYSYTTHKNSNYFLNNFSCDEWKAYEYITLKLMNAVLSKHEVLILVADHVVTPRDVKYEVNVKKMFNDEKKRLSIAGVCRFDSKSNDLLQVTDLLIGLITYDLKLQAKLVSGDKYKIKLVNYLKEKLGTNSFINGFKNYNFNIFVEKDNGEILENTEETTKENEKGPSS